MCWPLLRSWALRKFPLRNGVSFRFVRCGATQSERSNQELPLEAVALKTLVPQRLPAGPRVAATNGLGQGEARDSVASNHAPTMWARMISHRYFSFQVTVYVDDRTVRGPERQTFLDALTAAARFDTAAGHELNLTQTELTAAVPSDRHRRIFPRAFGSRVTFMYPALFSHVACESSWLVTFFCLVGRSLARFRALFTHSAVCRGISNSTKKASIPAQKRSAVVIPHGAEAEPRRSDDGQEHVERVHIAHDERSTSRKHSDALHLVVFEVVEEATGHLYSVHAEDMASMQCANPAKPWRTSRSTHPLHDCMWWQRTSRTSQKNTHSQIP